MRRDEGQGGASASSGGVEPPPSGQGTPSQIAVGDFEGLRPPGSLVAERMGSPMRIIDLVSPAIAARQASAAILPVRNSGLEDALFRLLHVMTEQKRLGNAARLLRFFVMLASFLQTLSLVCNPDLGWDAETWEALQWISLLKLLVPRADSLGSFLAGYIPAVAVVWLALADGVYVHGSLRSPAPSALLWPIRTLRVVVTLLLSAGFIPVMTILLVPFDCDLLQRYVGSELVCHSSAHLSAIIASALTLTLLVPAACLLALTHFEANPLSGNPIARPSSRVDCAETIFRTIMVVAVLFVSSATLVALLMVFLTGFHAVLVIGSLPYYSQKTNERRAALSGMLFWLSLGSLVVSASGSAAGSPERLWITASCACTSPLAGLAAVCGARRRFQWLRSLAMRVKSGNVEEHSRRYRWLSAVSPQTTSAHTPQSSGARQPRRSKLNSVLSAGELEGDMTLSECITKHLVFETDIEVMVRAILQNPTEESVKRAGLLFYEAMFVFPSSLYLRLQYCTFLQLHRRGTVRALSLLQDAQRFSGAIDLRYARWSRMQEWYQMRQTSQIGGRSLDIVSVVAFMKEYNGTLARHIGALRALRHFWGILARQRAPAHGRNTARALSYQLHKIRERTREAHDGYVALAARFPNSEVLRQSYGLFLLNVVQDEEGAAKLLGVEGLTAGPQSGPSDKHPASPAGKLRQAMPGFAFMPEQSVKRVTDTRTLLRRFFIGVAAVAVTTIVFAYFAGTSPNCVSTSLEPSIAAEEMRGITLDVTEAVRDYERHGGNAAAVDALRENVSSFDAALRHAHDLRGVLGDATLAAWRDAVVPIADADPLLGLRSSNVTLFDAASVVVGLGLKLGSSAADPEVPVAHSEQWVALAMNMMPLADAQAGVAQATWDAALSANTQQVGVIGLVAVFIVMAVGLAVVVLSVWPAHARARKTYKQLTELARHVPRSDAQLMHDHYGRLCESFAVDDTNSLQEVEDEERDAPKSVEGVGREVVPSGEARRVGGTVGAPKPSHAETGLKARVTIAPLTIPPSVAAKMGAVASALTPKLTGSEQGIMVRDVPFPSAQTFASSAPVDTTDADGHTSASEVSWQSPASSLSQAEPPPAFFRDSPQNPSRDALRAPDDSGWPQGRLGSPASDPGGRLREFAGSRDVVKRAETQTNKKQVERTRTTRAAVTSPLASTASAKTPTPSARAGAAPNRRPSLVARRSSERSGDSFAYTATSSLHDIVRSVLDVANHGSESERARLSAGAARRGEHDSLPTAEDHAVQVSDKFNFDGDLIEIATRSIENEAMRAASRVQAAARTALAGDDRATSIRSHGSHGTGQEWRRASVRSVSNESRPAATGASADREVAASNVVYSSGAPKVGLPRTSLSQGLRRELRTLPTKGRTRNASPAGDTSGEEGSDYDAVPYSARSHEDHLLTLDLGQHAINTVGTPTSRRSRSSHGGFHKKNAFASQACASWRHAAYLTIATVALVLAIPGLLAAGWYITNGHLSSSVDAALASNASIQRALAAQQASFLAREASIGDGALLSSVAAAARLASQLAAIEMLHDELRLYADDILGTDQGVELAELLYGEHSDENDVIRDVTSGMNLLLLRFTAIGNALLQASNDTDLVDEMRRVFQRLRELLDDATALHLSIVHTKLDSIVTVVLAVVLAVVGAVTVASVAFHRMAGEATRSAGTLALFHTIMPHNVDISVANANSSKRRGRETMRRGGRKSARVTQAPQAHSG